MQKDEIAKLAAGALNSIARHRRDALWEARRAIRSAGPLLEESPAAAQQSPLPAPETGDVSHDFH